MWFIESQQLQKGFSHFSHINELIKSNCGVLNILSIIFAVGHTYNVDLVVYLHWLCGFFYSLFHTQV